MTDFSRRDFLGTCFAGGAYVSGLMSDGGKPPSASVNAGRARSENIISLPKGGGALQAIGEKFSPDLFTGTGNYSVDISIPPGRNGFQPRLQLLYSTGNGNSPFGLGWSLSIPGVARKTSKGIPRYDDAKDVFILSGLEDLVPIDPGTAVTRYRPRTDESFSRILHHHDPATVGDYWEVHSKDGLISRYGTHRAADAPANWRDPAVIADPDNPSRRYAWKLTETVDPFGNRIEFLYTRDEANELGPRRWDQVYLSEVRYIDYGDTSGGGFVVNIKFRYCPRPDAFSEYRQGFEVRTLQRCNRIEISTNPGTPTRLRTYHLAYLDEQSHASDQLPLNGASLLAQVDVEGHDDATGSSQKLPPLRFSYGQFEPESRVFSRVRGESLPSQSLAAPEYELVDLFGRGLPDIVAMNGTVRYWRNLGEGRFDHPRSMSAAPSHRLSAPGVQLLDADGDGRADLVVTAPPVGGYYPLTFHGEWDRRSFRRWDTLPSVSLDDPEVKLVDLDGDGITDALRSGSSFECYFNDPTHGWKETRLVARRQLDVFPNVRFSDSRVKWADMSGDGLTDIVLVHDDRIDYWPSLGRGDFGPRLTMRNAPEFPHRYNPERVLIGDVDGDGVADLVYVDNGKVTLWINQGGNNWSAPVEIDGTPSITDTDSVRLVDLLGTGVPGVLWSREAGLLREATLFFLDFTGGHKPYLLERIENSMGAVTHIEYASSTDCWFEDHGTPREWQTSLPFPVHVVKRVQSIDRISGGKLATEYSYHHGYWDGSEREFRGFGRVDQRDTETFDSYHATQPHDKDTVFAAVDPTRFSPPVETRNWFHLGPVGDELGGWSELDYSSEFWNGDPQALTRSEEVHAALQVLPLRARRDAVRGLRGRILRTELYAHDHAPRADRPFSVTEKLYGLRVEPSPLTDVARPRIFFPFVEGERTTHWERGDDPMTQIGFWGGYDLHGHPNLHLNIAVPRGRDYRQTAAPGAPSFLATFTDIGRAKRDDASAYIVDRTAHQTTFELIDDGRLDSVGLRPNAAELWKALVTWNRGTGPGLRRQVVAQSLYYYDGNDFRGLPLEEIGTQGALKRVEELVITEAIIQAGYRTGAAVDFPPEEPPYFSRTGTPAWTGDYPAEFQARVSDRQMVNSGTSVAAGYVYHQGDTVRIKGFFAPVAQRAHNARGLVVAERNALGQETGITYDDVFDLLPIKVTDPESLEIAAVYNDRVLMPAFITDANGNETFYAYTPLGLLDSIAVLGKPGLDEGDTPTAPGITFTYAFDVFRSSGQPVYTHTVRRTNHITDPDDTGQTIETREFSDGFGRLLQTRTIAEEVLFGSANFGDAVVPVDQTLNATPTATAASEGNPNVVVSGLHIYDNKGRIVEKYEPFFSHGWNYGRPTAVERGQKSTFHFDPRGRIIRSVNPDRSEQLTVFGIPHDIARPDDFVPTPWESYEYDGNDNAGRTHASEGSASGYASHFNTPTSTTVDGLGRAIELVERNALSSAAWYRTNRVYDIRGNLLMVRDHLGRVTLQHVYDLAGREVRSEHLDSGIRRTVYDAVGGVLERRDAKEGLILLARDRLGRTTRVWARDSRSGAVRLTESIAYGDDPATGLSVTDGRLKNLRGKPHVHLDEAGQVVFEEYDFKGNVVEKARRVINDSQILSVFAALTANNRQVATYKVDWQPGAGISSESHASTLLDGTIYRTSQRYDAISRVKQVDYPADIQGSRRRLTPRYNAAGALQRVHFDGAVFVEHIAYNAKGLRTLIAYGDRVATNVGPRVMTRYAYDPRSFRLVRKRTERYIANEAFSFVPNGGMLEDVAYEYDLAGNLIKVRDRGPNSGTATSPHQLDRAFTYDPLYRLVSATGRECQTDSPAPWDPSPRCHDVSLTRPYTENYVYDPVGNLKRLEHHVLGVGGTPTRHFELSPNSNRLSTMHVGGLSHQYVYDDAGNMTLENTERHLEWDHSNRLCAFRIQPPDAEPSQYAHYLYDSSGHRVKKLVRKQGGAVEVTVFVDGVFEHHLSISGAGPAEHNTMHLLDLDSRIATVRVGNDPADATPEIKFYLNDNIGSSTLVISQTGLWTNREEYTPYGSTSFGSFAKKRYRYSGKPCDAESGLYYYGARYYAPWLCRWTATDPIGILGGTLNLYQFGRSSPLRFRDSTGRSTEDILDYAQASADQPLTRLPAENLNPQEVGNRAHKGFELDMTFHDANLSGLSGEEFQRIVPELQVDEKGIIVAYGHEPGKAPKGGRTVDAAILKEGITRQEIELGKTRASDVVEAGVDFKTGQNRLRGVGELRRLLGAPVLAVRPGGDLRSSYQAALSRLGSSGAVMKSAASKAGRTLRASSLDLALLVIDISLNKAGEIAQSTAPASNDEIEFMENWGYAYGGYDVDAGRNLFRYEPTRLQRLMNSVYMKVKVLTDPVLLRQIISAPVGDPSSA